MPSPAFTLSVPADAPFRGLAAEAVRVYLRASGGSPSPAGDAFVASVAAAVERLTAGGADIELAVVSRSPEIDVHLTSGGASETLTHIPAASGG
jgi:hypothetical protein